MAVNVMLHGVVCNARPGKALDKLYMTLCEVAGQYGSAGSQRGA